jgi:hypothetical protein
VIRLAGYATALALLWSFSGHASATGPEAFLEPSQVLRGNFEQQRHLAGLDRALVSRGRFVVIGNRGVLWRTEDPFQFDLVIAPTGILQVMPGETPVELAAASAGASYFFGILEQVFASKSSNAALDTFLVRQTSGPGSGWTRTLIPKSELLASRIETIVIIGTEFVDKVEIRRSSGDFDIFVFTDQSNSNEAPTDDELELFGHLVEKTTPP